MHSAGCPGPERTAGLHAYFGVIERHNVMEPRPGCKLQHTSGPMVSYL